MTASVRGRKLPCFLIYFLALLRPAFVDRSPILYVGRHISVPAILDVPIAVRTHLLFRETGFEITRSAFLARSALSTGGAVSAVLSRRRAFWRGLRDGNAVNGQQPAQASILFAESNILCSGASNGSESEPLSAISFHRSGCFNSTFSGNSAIREVLLWSPMHVSKCATVPLDKRETVLRLRLRRPVPQFRKERLANGRGTRRPATGSRPSPEPSCGAWITTDRCAFQGAKHCPG